MNKSISVPPPSTMVIFGASGDLTERKLIPALHSLDCEGLLAKQTRILGVARSEFSDDEFREHLRKGVIRHGRCKPEIWSDFSQRVSYMVGYYDDPDTYQQIKDRLEENDKTTEAQHNRLFYLAIPPELYPVVIQRIGEAGLNQSENGWVRLIIEKPFGHNLQSAHKLNELVHHWFSEDQVYRIDHFLGKETVQNILAFRFANIIFHEIWERNYIDYVEISVIEEIGLENRAGYYDQTGAIRDMLQNHMLQLLSLIAMEPPAAMNAKELRDEKVKVLKAVHPFTAANSVLGQYEGYREETGVKPDSRTPTYVAARTFVENWRWQGVPFYLRTGKNLIKKSTEIVLQFKHVPHLIFPKETEVSSNRLSICIQPDEGMHLTFELKVPGGEMRTSPVMMDFHYKDIFGEMGLPEAYERLLLDALQGDAALFARSDEIERSWELVEPLLQETDKPDGIPILPYAKGSLGPSRTETLFSELIKEKLVSRHFPQLKLEKLHPAD